MIYPRTVIEMTATSPNEQSVANAIAIETALETATVREKTVAVNAAMKEMEIER